MLRLAILLLCAALLAHAVPAEAGWRPKRQVRSLEAGDGLGKRLFGKTRRNGWKAAAARRRRPAPAPMNVEAWLSRYGPVKASRGETPPPAAEGPAPTRPVGEPPAR